VDPYAPLASAVRRIPDRNVVEISPDAGISAVIAAMQAGQVGHVVLTEHGQPYGHTSPRLVNEAAERN
jgi:predicted transcriptional regulator